MSQVNRITVCSTAVAYVLAVLALAAIWPYQPRLTLPVAKGTWPIAWSPDQEILVAIDRESQIERPDGQPDQRTLTLWNTADGEIERTLLTGLEDVWKVIVAPDQRTLVVMGGEYAGVDAPGQTVVFDCVTGREIVRRVGVDMWALCESVAYSPNGRYLAVYDPDTEQERGILILEVPSGRRLTRLPQVAPPMVFTLDFNYLACAQRTPFENAESKCRLRGFELRNVRTGQLQTTFALPKNPDPERAIELNQLGFSPDGRLLIGVADQQLRHHAAFLPGVVCWNRVDGSIRVIEWECRAVARSFDHTQIAIEAWNDDNLQFDLLTPEAAERRPIRAEHPSELTDWLLSVSHDGVFIACQIPPSIRQFKDATWMQRLHCWFTGDDSVPASLIGHRCSDGRELWQLPVETQGTMEIFQPLPINQTVCVHVSPRGDALAMERLAGGIDIYDLPPRRSWVSILIAAFPLALFVGVPLGHFWRQDPSS